MRKETSFTAPTVEREDEVRLGFLRDAPGPEYASSQSTICRRSHFTHLSCRTCRRCAAREGRGSVHVSK
jgi:hypothetical protein